MERSRLRNLGLILGGIVVAVGLLTVGFFVSYTQQKAVDPADVLPLDATLALFQNTSPDSAKRYASIYPSLASLPSGNDQMHIAVLKNGADEGWVLFPHTVDTPLPSGPTVTIRHLGRSFTVLLSSESLASLFGNDDEMLQADDEVKLIRGSVPSSSITAILRMDRLVTMTGATADPLLNALQVRYIAVAEDSGHHVIIPAGNFPATQLLGNRDALCPDPTVALRVEAANATSLLKALEELPEEMQLGWRARLTATLRNSFGSDVSLEGDVLPLLSEPMTLLIGSGGTMALAVEGKTATNVGDRLFESAKVLLPSSALLERTFDAERHLGVRAVIEADLEEKKGTRNGWEIRSVDAGGGNGVWVATKGEQIVASRSPLLLDAVIAERSCAASTPVTLPSLRQNPLLVVGQMDGEHVSSLMQSWLKQSPLFLILLPELGQGKPLGWALRGGTVWSLSLRTR